MDKPLAFAGVRGIKQFDEDTDLSFHIIPTVLAVVLY
jgi:hypothetical protein